MLIRCRPRNSLFARMTLAWYLLRTWQHYRSLQSTNLTPCIAVHQNIGQLEQLISTVHRLGHTQCLLLKLHCSIPLTTRVSLFIKGVCSELSISTALTGKINLVDLAGSENNKVGPTQSRYFSSWRLFSWPETIHLVWPSLQLSINHCLFLGKLYMPLIKAPYVPSNILQDLITYTFSSPAYHTGIRN